MSLGDWLDEAVADKAAEQGVRPDDLETDDRLDAIGERISRLSRRDDRSGEDRRPSARGEPRRRRDDPVASQDEARRSDELLEAAIARLESRAERQEARAVRAIKSVARWIERSQADRGEQRAALQAVAEKLDAIDQRAARGQAQPAERARPPGTAVSTRASVRASTCKRPFRKSPAGAANSTRARSRPTSSLQARLAPFRRRLRFVLAPRPRGAAVAPARRGRRSGARERPVADRRAARRDAGPERAPRANAPRTERTKRAPSARRARLTRRDRGDVAQPRRSRPAQRRRRAGRSDARSERARRLDARQRRARDARRAGRGVGRASLGRPARSRSSRRRAGARARD